MSEREHRFTPTSLLLVGSLLIWMADFVVVYVFAALACARGFASSRVFGMPIVAAVTTMCTVAAAVCTVFLLRHGLAAMRNTASTEHGRFIGFVAFTTSVLAILAFILLALPPLAISACAR